MPLRVSAISFLNPAPLLYNFEHEPAASELHTRYAVHYTTPARCAAELHGGQADLGLIPVAELTPDLVVVPGCTIASQKEVRSILLLVRCNIGTSEDAALRTIRSIATDSASRSSTAYVQVILRRFFACQPRTEQLTADPLAMLLTHEAALLIGDPALLARERRREIDEAVSARFGQDLLWVDVAALWRRSTGLPWVAAVWALRASALESSHVSSTQLVADLNLSRDAGLAHIDELVTEWLPRVALPAEVIHTYLTRNIYYRLDDPCLEAIRLFRHLAAETGVLPELPSLTLVPSQAF